MELSIAMQKHAIYPGGHPLLTEAVDGVMKKVALLLADRDSLSIGIARRQLGEARLGGDTILSGSLRGESTARTSTPGGP